MVVIQDDDSQVGECGSIIGEKIGESQSRKYSSKSTQFMTAKYEEEKFDSSIKQIR